MKEYIVKIKQRKTAPDTVMADIERAEHRDEYYFI